MTHGSLFSGIGGFDLAAEWMGWQNVFHCEWNTFGQRVLKHYWPNAISYNDITKTDFTIHRGRIDILTGGFPCQPYSMAGKRLGKEDDRHLWPEMLRAIREIQPRWVVGENVLGLVNWSDGLVFHEVQADLEAEGYEVQPFVLPACAVNAPHRRDRIWFVAYSKSAGAGSDIGGIWSVFNGCNKRKEDESLAADTDSSATGTPREGRSIKSNWSGDNVQQSERREQTEQHNRSSSFSWDAADTSSRHTRQGGDTPQGGSECSSEERKAKGSGVVSRQGVCRNVKGKGRCGSGFVQGISNAIDAADTDYKRLERSASERVQDYERGRGEISNAKFTWMGKQSSWQNFPTVSPICDGNDGIPDRLDGITFSKWRQESIKAGGNAVVPQVVFQIFKTIAEYEKLTIQRPSV